MTDPDLDSAYALSSPDDVRALYRTWATTYDSDFIERMGYVYPHKVAEAFARQGHGGDTGAMLDIGCGSGAVAEAMRGRMGAQTPTMDGLDLSPEMLAVAGEKGLYRHVIEGDLLGKLPIADARYDALVSAGTFTHGHVGPAALPELLRIARSGALFCLGINGAWFEAHGFGAAFDALASEGAITGLAYADSPIYADAEHDHAGDRALIAVFRKA